MKIDVVILAAGQGTRMCSSKPKVLHSIGGKAMLRHVVEAAEALGDVAVHIVVGHGSEQVEAELGSKCNYIVQSEQLGTAHAALQALPLLSEGSKTLILYGDVPLIKTDTLKAMIDSIDDNSMAVLTVEMKDPTGYGRLLRSANGSVEAIVEQKDARSEQLAITEVNTGIMCIPQQLLEQWLRRINNDNAQQEYYLPDVIQMAVKDDVVIHTPQPKSHYEVQGVNNRAQQAELERVYQGWQAERLMEAGASLADPARIDVRGELTVGQDVFIDVNAVFSGRVILGNRVKIGANCVISDTEISDDTEIFSHCVVHDSIIAKACSVGPFARLRPGTRLDEKAKVGNYVEIKNSHLGEGSKASHLSYIGDTEIGIASNIGAGTITCNYDGVNKFKTVMGDNVFIGSNSTLVAPLEIEDGSFVAAGSTITKTVPSENLAVGRGRQKNISGWEKPTKPRS